MSYLDQYNDDCDNGQDGGVIGTVAELFGMFVAVVGLAYLVWRYWRQA